MDHEIIVELKGFVFLSLQAIEHKSPARREFQSRDRGLNRLNDGFLILVLKVAEEDVLDDRLIGGPFGDDSEFEHAPPRRREVRNSSADRRCSRA